MTLAELRQRWERRRDEWARFGVLLDGVKFANELVSDLEQLAEADAECITLTEAHRLGGYSVDRLQRLVAAGDIENVGRKGRPRIRRSDVPVKPGHRLPDEPDGVQLSERRRIAASVIKGQS